MISAYILINAEVGEDAEVKNQLQAIPAIKQVHFVYGVYDFVCRIEAPAISQINEIQKTQIQKIPPAPLAVVIVQDILPFFKCRENITNFLYAKIWYLYKSARPIISRT